MLSEQIAKIKLLLYDLAKKENVGKYFKVFSKYPRKSKDEILELQLTKLKKLLVFAFENNDFYQRRFKDSNFNPHEFVHLQDLQKIPVLTREDLQSHWRSLISKNINRKISKGSSSGSTGYPVFYYKDSNAYSAGYAARYTGWGLSGWKLGMKGLHIWGNPAVVNNQWVKPISKIKARVLRHYKFPAYKLTEGKKFDELIEILNKNEFDFIDGYTNAIYLAALHLKTNTNKLSKRIPYVFTTGETLHDFQSDIINEMIGDVYDCYGCSEVNGIAIQCKQCLNYHVLDFHVCLEYGKTLNENGSREVIVTDLDNYVFPLIRYQNDDSVIPVSDNNDTHCEYNLSSIKKVTGRQSDILKFSNGGTLSVPSFFGSVLLKKINGLKQYQIRKVDEDMIFIDFVVTSEFKETDKDLINSALDEYLANNIQYQINIVDKIEIQKNGKFKLLVDLTKTND